jgi:hypothetical protein
MSCTMKKKTMPDMMMCMDIGMCMTCSAEKYDSSCIVSD